MSLGAEWVGSKPHQARRVSMLKEKATTSAATKIKEPSATDEERAALSERPDYIEEDERKKLVDTFIDTFRRFVNLKVVLAAAFLFVLGGAIVYSTYERAKTEALFYII